MFSVITKSLSASKCLSVVLSIWSTARLSVCLSDCLTVWPSDLLTVWTSDRLNSDRLNAWLSDCLNVWLSKCLTLWLTVWLSDCLAVWPSDCLTGWLSVCLPTCLSGCYRVDRLVANGSLYDYLRVSEADCWVKPWLEPGQWKSRRRSGGWPALHYCRYSWMIN